MLSAIIKWCEGDRKGIADLVSVDWVRHEEEEGLQEGKQYLVEWRYGVKKPGTGWPADRAEVFFVAEKDECEIMLQRVRNIGRQKKVPSTENSFRKDEPITDPHSVAVKRELFSKENSSPKPRRRKTYHFSAQQSDLSEQVDGFSERQFSSAKSQSDLRRDRFELHRKRLIELPQSQLRDNESAQKQPESDGSKIERECMKRCGEVAKLPPVVTSALMQLKRISNPDQMQPQQIATPVQTQSRRPVPSRARMQFPHVNRQPARFVPMPPGSGNVTAPLNLSKSTCQQCIGLMDANGRLLQENQILATEVQRLETVLNSEIPRLWQLVNGTPEERKESQMTTPLKSPIRRRSREESGEEDILPHNNEVMEEESPAGKGVVKRRIKAVKEEQNSYEYEFLAGEEDFGKSDEEEMVEIFPDSKVYCSASGWALAEECTSASSFVRKLLVQVFDMNTLLKSNLRGGKCKWSESNGTKEALDVVKVEALYAAALDRFPESTHTHLGQTINSKIVELRNQTKRNYNKRRNRAVKH